MNFTQRYSTIETFTGNVRGRTQRFSKKIILQVEVIEQTILSEGIDPNITPDRIVSSKNVWRDAIASDITETIIFNALLL